LGSIQGNGAAGAAVEIEARGRNIANATSTAPKMCNLLQAFAKPFSFMFLSLLPLAGLLSDLTIVIVGVFDINTLSFEPSSIPN
jgi:hypothetical protein